MQNYKVSISEETLNSNELLIGTDHGLWLFDHNQQFNSISVDKYSDIKVFDIYKNHRNEILLGTDVALLQFDLNEMKLLPYKTVANSLLYKELDLNNLQNTRILHLKDYFIQRDSSIRRDSIDNQYLEQRLSNEEQTIFLKSYGDLKSHLFDCSDTVLIGSIYGYGIFCLDYKTKYFNHGQFNTTLDNRVDIIETNRVNKVYVDSMNSLWGLTEFNGGWLSKGVYLNDNSKHCFSTPEQMDFIPYLGVQYNLSTLQGDAYQSDNFKDMVYVSDQKYLVITEAGELLKIDVKYKSVDKLYHHSSPLHSIVVSNKDGVILRDEFGLVKYNFESGVLNRLGKDDGILYPGRATLFNEDGTIYLGGKGGISKVNLSLFDMPKDSNIQIYCKSVKVMGKEISFDPDVTINLDYNQNFLETNLSHLNLTQRSFIYEYRIPSIHQNWLETNNKISYQSLLPGVYEIQTRVKDFSPSKSIAVLKFKIHPPWWKTWWFYCSTSIILTFILYSGYRYKLNEEKNRSKLKLKAEIKAQEAERARLSRELHDDFGMRMSALRMYVDAIEQISIGKDNKLKSLSDKATNLVDESMKDFRNILSNLSPNTLRINGLIAGITDIIDGINSLQVIKVNLFSDYKKEDLSPEQELNTFRIIQELLNNSVKHSQCTEVELKILKLNNFIELSYLDNGVGYNQEDKRQGFGFANIKTRINALDGTFDMSGERGFTFNAKIPINDN